MLSYAKCGNCGGKGTVPCGTCGGYGTKGGKPCWTCNGGKGFVCTACGGKGYV